MNYIINRLKEPSTWSGLGMLAVSLGLGIPPGAVEAVTQVGVGLAGLVSIFLREKSGA
ncbi:hypothetical protein [Acidovorax delafieldii]|uniref:hypothetical protein n=1 Tax=Acidovorax delafieldii TaxID=47920 RepID=UPI003ECEF1DA